MLPDVVEPSSSELKPNDWNDVDVVIDANIFRPWVNTSASGGGAADDDLGAFGPIAIYVGGSGEVRFRDVSYRDLSLKRVVPEQLSSNYRMLRLNAVLLFVRVGRGRFRSRRQHGHRLGTLHLPGTGFHEGP